MKEVKMEKCVWEHEEIKTRSFKIKPKKGRDYVLAQMKLYASWLEEKKKEILAI